MPLAAQELRWKDGRGDVLPVWTDFRPGERDAWTAIAHLDTNWLGMKTLVASFPKPERRTLPV